MRDGNGTDGTTGVGHHAAGNGATANGEGSLSHGLAGRLRALERCVSPDQIHELWVFPPLPDLDRSAEFLLFTRYVDGEARRLCAAEFPQGGGSDGTAPQADGHAAHRANGNGNGNSNGKTAANGNGHGAPAAEAQAVRITEYGRVPRDRVERLVSGFRRRLADDREPLHVPIDGSAEHWNRLLSDAGPEPAGTRENGAAVAD